MRTLLTVGFLVLLLDQLTKHFLKNEVFIVTSFFKIDYVENTGAAFGMLKGFNILFIAVALLVVFFIFKYYEDINKEGFHINLAVGFLLGGTIGNLIDRMLLGYVRDFISFSFWPTFNLADTFSTVAAIILTFYVLFKK